LLTNNELWFGEPRNFNDPFDTRYLIDADPREDEILNFYFNNALAQESRRNLELAKFKQEFNIPTKKQFLNDLEQHHYINTLSKKHGICCFSEKYNNHLMWSHYADNVKGVCLVFDWKASYNSNELVFTGQRVKYRNTLSKKFYDSSKYWDITDIIYSKTNMWKYENEIRELCTFEANLANRAVKFNPKVLVGIIFGANTSQNEKETLKNLILQLTKNNICFIDSSVDLPTHTLKFSKNILKLK
jgi:hypothetical protein